LPKLVDHEERRALLLEGALPLFAERGYSALSVRVLAKELGVSTGVLYYYFESKEALFKEMFVWLGERDAAEASVAVRQGSDTSARLALLSAHVLERAPHLTQVLKVALDYQRQHPDEEGVFFAPLNAYRDALKVELGVSVPEQSNLIISLILGLLIQYTLDPQGAPIEPQLTTLLNLGGLFTL
jgi:AcrR family transcriptional regulator